MMRSFRYNHRETDASIKVIAGSRKSADNMMDKLTKKKKDWKFSEEMKIGNK